MEEAIFLLLHEIQEVDKLRLSVKHKSGMTHADHGPDRGKPNPRDHEVQVAKNHRDFDGTTPERGQKLHSSDSEDWQEPVVKWDTRDRNSTPQTADEVLEDIAQFLRNSSKDEWQIQPSDGHQDRIVQFLDNQVGNGPGCTEEAHGDEQNQS